MSSSFKSTILRSRHRVSSLSRGRVYVQDDYDPTDMITQKKASASRSRTIQNVAQRMAAIS
jgi:ABC-type proline/glycine betaine transport system ATPase subunit